MRSRFRSRFPPRARLFSAGEARSPQLRLCREFRAMPRSIPGPRHRPHDGSSRQVPVPLAAAEPGRTLPGTAEISGCQAPEGREPGERHGRSRFLAKGFLNLPLAEQEQEWWSR